MSTATLRGGEHLGHLPCVLVLGSLSSSTLELTGPLSASPGTVTTHRTTTKGRGSSRRNVQ